ncbi:uncharacterized protein ARB_05016 [Trichophyton benhamiae CBS 112371]|uniref:Uncharacterized protein n=1 Tax=Arthroderma benhamiae (strain ATCC MYA-4681 / CBS 112371) TaxID=663331 RepID=D4AL20_ARTBC|nr:uncharacterized protein ARB_05016 [Trichophyton benhamiae CBS 112371]EFE36079.1 hypothetical protein ARB_05016 [Trichophyton benhamiae CBS 112371]
MIAYKCSRYFSLESKDGVFHASQPLQKYVEECLVFHAEIPPDRRRQIVEGLSLSPYVIYPETPKPDNKQPDNKTDKKLDDKTATMDIQTRLRTKFRRDTLDLTLGISLSSSAPYTTSNKAKMAARRAEKHRQAKEQKKKQEREVEVVVIRWCIVGAGPPAYYDDI